MRFRFHERPYDYTASVNIRKEVIFFLGLSEMDGERKVRGDHKFINNEVIKSRITDTAFKATEE